MRAQRRFQPPLKGARLRAIVQEPALTADFPSKRRLRARASRGLSHRARRADRAAARGHFEGVAEGGEVLARVIILVGELRNAEVVRPRFLTFVDAWIEIDEMPAWLAGRHT